MTQFEHLDKNSNSNQFRASLREEFDNFLEQQSNRFDRENCLQVDLHCHDLNSNTPDELWGRILGVPETWLETQDLVKILQNKKCDVITVTNHNNARSCWELQDRDFDALSAAEFTCHFLEYDLFIHVLTYGFTRAQECILNKKRSNIYDFLKYAAQNNIPVVLPHPLYFYTKNTNIDTTLFEKFAVMFERFEVLNGQRDLWQSVLTLNWVRSLTPEKITQYAEKHNLNPADYGVNPYKPKVVAGGSDDHTGIFAGDCGSYLYVPNLQERLKTEKASDLALEAIRSGNIAPFGSVHENEKLNIAVLSYFSQVAIKIKDPGLLRMLLHRGEVKDKIACFIIANLLMEMQKHRHTKKFFTLIHDALQGKKPNAFIKWCTSKDFRFCIEHLERIAEAKNHSPDFFVKTVNNSVAELFTQLNQLIVDRLQKIPLFADGGSLENISMEEITRKFEMPTQLTALFFDLPQKRSDMSNVNIKQVLDHLSFPILITIILASVAFTSTRVLYANRSFLNNLSNSIGRSKHSERALWLTDTLRDKNGVSNSLTGKLKEIQRIDAPVDFLVCHADAESEPHLHVVRPITSFSVPGYEQQAIRIPDLMEIVRIFYEGGYDRIVCSTEGPMAAVSLFLKMMFSVPAHFFMHTDWVDFVKYTTKLNQHERDRIRRLLRAVYKCYDGLFVLNSDHRAWLTGHEMELEDEKVHLTAHYTKPRDISMQPADKREFFTDANEETPVLFIASRISAEKGIFDLPDIVANVKKSIPDIRIVIAGCGPSENLLKEKLPEAKFLGWIDHNRLAQCYLGLDLFVFPSRFDTFGNVILESFIHGMPAVVYNCKGPKDIVEHGVNGFLAEDIQQMSDQIIQFFSHDSDRNSMRDNAIRRAKEYRAEPIMQQFLSDLGLVKQRQERIQKEQQTSAEDISNPNTERCVA